MKLKEKALKGIFWSIIDNVGKRSISFLLFLILARLLEPEMFGLIALASVFISFVEIFITQGFTDAIIQRQKLESEHLNTAFWTNMAIAIVMTILGMTGAQTLANFFAQPLLTPIIRWLSLNFLLIGLSKVQEAILRRNLNFKALTRRSLFAQFSASIIAVGMAFSGYGVWSLVVQSLVNSIVAAIVLWQVSDWRPKLEFSYSHFRDLFSFGINLFGFSIFNFLNMKADDLLIGYFLGTIQLGYYVIAYRILLLMTDLLVNTIAQVALPTFSKLQAEPEKLKQGIYQVIQLTSLVAFPAFLGVASLAPEIIISLFGKQWIPSIPVMRILAFMGIINALYNFNGAILTSIGKPFWKLALGCLDAIGNVTAFALVVKYGIVAVAAAFVIRGYLFLPIPILLIRRLTSIKITTYFRQCLTPLVSSLVMVLSIFWCKYWLSSWLNIKVILIICTLISAVIYFLSIRFFDPQLFKKVFSLINIVISGKKPNNANINL